jgi:voltage-gated potassium channel
MDPSAAGSARRRGSGRVRRRLPADAATRRMTAVAVGARLARNRRVAPLAAPYELFMLLLSGLSMFNAVAVGVARLGRPSGPAEEVVIAMEVAMTPLFVVDFLYRLRVAPSRRTYLVQDRGWADLLACVPLLRIVRLVRVAQVVRGMRLLGRERVLAELGASRAIATFLLTVFLVIVVVEVASATIYYAEKGARGSNVETAGDAIWWSLVTITSVGYGDKFPVTQEGRVIGVFLLFAGVALFSVMTGFIANAFLAPRTRRRAGGERTDALGTLVAVRSLLAEQEETTKALRAQLDQLERLMEPAGDVQRDRIRDRRAG